MGFKLVPKIWIALLTLLITYVARSDDTPASADNAAINLMIDCQYDSNPDIKIAACTKLIQALSDAGRFLSTTSWRSYRAQAYIAKRDWANARNDLNTLVDMSPNDPKAYVNRCLLNDETGQYDAAIADCTKANQLNAEIMSDAELASIYYDRGVDYQKKAQTQQALSDFNEALRLYPEFSKAHYARETLLHLQDH